MKPTRAAAAVIAAGLLMVGGGAIAQTSAAEPHPNAQKNPHPETVIQGAGEEDLARDSREGGRMGKDGCDVPGDRQGSADSDR